MWRITLVFVPLLVLVGSACVSAASEAEIGDIVADVSKASIRCTRWLSKYLLSEGIPKLDALETSHVAILNKLLLCDEGDCQSGALIRERLTELNQVDLENSTTSELIWRAIASKAAPECTTKNYTFTMVEALLKRIEYFPNKEFNHPASLSLSLVAISLHNIKIPWVFVRRFLTRIRLGSKRGAYDTYSYQLLALCAIYNQQSMETRKHALHRQLKLGLKDVDYWLTKEDLNDVTIAMLLQAKTSIEKTILTKSRKFPSMAFRRLLAFQTSDGSFGTVAATTTTLFALTGLSVLNLQQSQRNTVLTADKKDFPEKTVLACAAISFQGDREKDPPTQYMRVKQNTTALEVLRKAAAKHPCFKFEYTQFSWGIFITKVCGISQDHVNKRYWMFYTGETMAKGGISDHIVEEGKCIRLVMKAAKF